MRACLTLHHLAASFLPVLPKPRLQLLLDALDAVIRSERLTLTGIGRSLSGKAFVKHKIKRIYRLLANSHIQQDLPLFFSAIAKQLIPPKSTPLILIDWTPYGLLHHALVAAIRHDGRAIPIALEVHPQKHLGNPDIEQRFLRRLHRTLPTGCRPILVTDAGFRNPWFKYVQKLGWDFVGRLTNSVKAQPSDANADIWLQLKILHERATGTPKSWGRWRVAKTNLLEMTLVLYRGESTRQPSQRRGQERRRSMSKKYRDRAAEPWMLVTSMSEASAAEVVGWYQARMQIEELFRDEKSIDTGLGLSKSRSYRVKHLVVLRLLGTLATLLTQIVGRVGENLGLHRRYQVNTVSDRRVLSLAFLGRQILQHGDLRCLSRRRLEEALDQIRQRASASFIS